MEVWDLVFRYFSKNENWGDPEKIDDKLLYTIFLIRLELGIPFHVNNAYSTSGHSEDSYHYKGMALDGYFMTDEVSFVDIIDNIETVLEYYGLTEKVGFGIYPDWNNPGIHLDVRGYKARWSRIGKKYVSFELGLQRAKDKNL